MARSCSVAVIVSQEAANPLAALDLALRLAEFLTWINQLIAQSLMVSLSVIMFQELADSSAQHLLTEEDLIVRKHILNIMCNYETSWAASREQHPALFDGLKRLKEIESDKLISITPYNLKVLENGKPFLRNICMALDARLSRKETKVKLFSDVI